MTSKGGDFYLATSEDLYLAASGDSFMATDSAGEPLATAGPALVREDQPEVCSGRTAKFGSWIGREWLTEGRAG